MQFNLTLEKDTNMFHVGDLVHLPGYEENFKVQEIGILKILVVSTRNGGSGWIPKESLTLLKRVKKPETEVEFLDAFKNNFKDGI